MSSTTSLPTSKTKLAKDVYVARQAIYDRALNVYGYELLYRSSPENRANFVHPAAATAETLLNSYTSIGLGTLLEGRVAFVNLPREYLVGDYPLPCETSKLVLEVLEDVEIDEELLRGLERLSQMGFTIALDDVVYHSKLRALLLGVANIVKIDLRQLSRDELKEHVQEFRKYRVRLLAEKVETEEEFEDCIHLGFDLFQGYFLSRPLVFQGLRPHVSGRSLLKLLSRLTDPQSSIDELDRIVRSDVGLSYLAMQIIRSLPLESPLNVLDSIHRAVSSIGRDRVTTLALLVAVSQATESMDHDYSKVLRRARLCEKLALRRQNIDPNTAYTLGLVCGLDEVLGIPLAEVLDMLPISDVFRSALLHDTGPLGEVLMCARAYEEDDTAIQEPTVFAESVDKTTSVHV